MARKVLLISRVLGSGNFAVFIQALGSLEHVK